MDGLFDFGRLTLICLVIGFEYGKRKLWISLQMPDLTLPSVCGVDDAPDAPP